jgi:CRISPR-associated protein Cas2
MSRAEKLILICYDISDDSTRTRVAKRLERVATRVQYSVFEARLSINRAHVLVRSLEPLLEPGDSIRLYVLGAYGERHCRIAGDGPSLATKEGYWLI